MDTHMKLFTWRLQEVVGVLLVASGRCADTPRHRRNGHLRGRRRGLACWRPRTLGQGCGVLGFGGGVGREDLDILPELWMQGLC